MIKPCVQGEGEADGESRGQMQDCGGWCCILGAERVSSRFVGKDNRV